MHGQLNPTSYFHVAYALPLHAAISAACATAAVSTYWALAPALLLTTMLQSC